ncbi:type II toxin-antitoxin system VapC family toxin [Microlunatus elymi]|uniref:type II toxin-antitoxin system VapC family toxin n=1 Tax=Microlunatus elymi TaxID=2596828 RepID=UPI00143CD9E1|nr:type II toxin-antitoxin system VapC family toxin [Microlunatus elymi]
MTRRFAVDTAVFAYALGDSHHYREPCQAVVLAAGRGEFSLHASWELIQELLFHRMRRVERPLAVQQARAAIDLLELYDVDRSVVNRSMELILFHQGILGRDALHAATAIEHGLAVMISPDTAFDGVPGLERVDPIDLDLAADD